MQYNSYAEVYVMSDDWFSIIVFLKHIDNVGNAKF